MTLEPPWLRMRVEALEPGCEDGLQDVMEMYERRGATAQFSARSGGVVHCHDCGADEPAEQTPLVALHRFEGSSDPDDEAALAALECPSCGAWGTMVLSYGPGASPDDASVLGALLDDRDQSGIAPGV